MDRYQLGCFFGLYIYLYQLHNLSSCNIKLLASWVGQIISPIPVVGDAARLYSRKAQICNVEAPFWSCSVSINESIIKEIEFWLSNIDGLNKRFCFSETRPIVFDHILEGEASSTGCGSIDSLAITARNFSEQEKKTSSTFRELANIHFSILSFLPSLQNKTVKFLTDSQAAERIIKIGSINSDLQRFAQKIFDISLSNEISLTVSWIPRKQNNSR
jgi:hypothetical protein